MGILDFVAKQFVDVIDWVESEDGVLAYQYPMESREIQNGAKLTVRESQLALFVNEGKLADQFAPGLYTLNTNTLPILTYINNWDKAFQSPFKSDIYFFSTREQLDQKWGTATPLTIRDKDYGPIRVQAHGMFSYKLSDPKVFYQKVSGSRAIYKSEELIGQLRGLLLTTIASSLGNSAVGFIDMAANAEVFSQTILNALQGAFTDYGLTLQKFQVQSFSLPEEIQKRLDEKAGMSVVGNLAQYTQYQTAQSIPLAAANPGGIAGIGAGLGAGAAFAGAMTQAMTGAAPASAGQASGGDPFQMIEKLHNLMKAGAISAEEFEKKKNELMAKIG